MKKRSTKSIRGLDAGTEPYVSILRECGIETFESCEGGDGHTFSKPTICFYGDTLEGWRALAAAMQRGLPVLRLSYVWAMRDYLPDGPYWEMTFKQETS